MYIDKLEGRITAECFDTKAAEWRAGQANVKRMIDDHESANQNYTEFKKEP